jgi:NNP family nitrate/nitrite transporter-like MFS transporter
MVPVFGGRRWTAFSTGILIIPCVWLGFAVEDTSTPFSVFVIISLLWFCRGELCLQHGEHQLLLPERKQGGALGINGGLGNMGVSVMQLVAPLVFRCPSLPSLARWRCAAGWLIFIWKTPRGSGCRS